VKAMDNNPRQLSFQIQNTPTYTKGAFSMFCRKPKMSEVSKRRLWWTSGTEVRKIMRSEATSRVGRASYQTKIVASV
jgi:hypothetical protein